MKKFFSIILTGLMICSFAGCNNKDVSNFQKNSSIQNEENNMESNIESNATSEIDTTKKQMQDYVAPTELGNDYQSFIFRLDGKLYQLPVPISEFEKNGWEVTNKDKDVEPNKTKSLAVTLEKDGYKIFVERIKNYTNTTTTIENCSIIQFGLSTTFNPYEGLDFELPNGFSLKTTINDFKNQVNLEEYKKNKPGEFDFTTYKKDIFTPGKSAQYFSFEFNTDGTLNNFSLTNEIF